MKRIISGIKPTGQPHLGNYIGGMKPWVALQEEGENFYFIADLHAINARPEPKNLRQDSLNVLAWLLAMGIHPEKSVIFAEAQIAAHAELMAILNNYVTMGELSRMTQFKDKGQKMGPEGQVVGLFEYPVLMASDILLYDIDVVPVGEDQKQHVELVRDIASRFNKAHGNVFKVPEPLIQSVGARIMNLSNPSVKMSKSDNDQSGNVLLTDSPDQIRSKFRRAVTDSSNAIKVGPDKPALTNLIHIFSIVTGQSLDELEKHYQDKTYAQFKDDLAEAVVAELEPVQKRHAELMADEAALMKVLTGGYTKAAPLAETKIKQVKEVLGLL